MPADSAAVPNIMERIACLSRAYGLEDFSAIDNEQIDDITMLPCNNEPNYAETANQGPAQCQAGVEARILADSGGLVLHQVSKRSPTKKRLQHLAKHGAMMALLLALP